MNKRLLLFSSLLSSAIACNAELNPTQPRPNPNPDFRPGEPGTLVELADQKHQIIAMALSANYLYFAVPWAGIYRMPKYGGDVFAVQEDAHGMFAHVATDGEHVFWDYDTFDSMDYPHARIVSQTFDGAFTTTLADGAFGVYDTNVASQFQAAGGYLYWTGNPAGSNSATIGRVPTGGGGHETLLTYDDTINVPLWIADDSGLYFTTGGPFTSASDCVIERVSATGGAPEVLGACPDPRSFVVGSDTNAIYLQAPTTIWRVSKQDWATTVVQALDRTYFGWGVAFDDSNVYANTEQTWVSFPKTGGPMTPIIDSTVCPNIGGGWSTIAVDSDYLFLVCGAYDRIMVVPKPAAQ